MQEKVTEHLNILLADYQVFYQKLRAFHWNVKGPMFFTLHEKFEEMYDTVNQQVDDIAERIAALGDKPLGTLAAMVEKARLEEDTKTEQADDMVRVILADLKELTAYQRKLVALAQEAEDITTMNLVEGMADTQEKEAWMLQAFLG